MYTTDRLLIRAYQESDKEAVDRMLNHAETQRTTNPFPNGPSTPSNAEAMVTRLQAALFFGVVAVKEKPDELIGWVILRNMGSGNPNELAKNRNVMFGITILDGWQGKGYGTEATKFTVDWAFRMGGLHRVWLGFYEGNERAKKTYLRAGFKQEIVIRKDNWLDGRWWDTTLMAILDEDWEKDPQYQTSLLGF